MSWVIFWLLQFKAWLISLWMGPKPKVEVKVKEAQELRVDHTEVIKQGGKVSSVKVHLSDGAVIEPLRYFHSDQEAYNLAQAWDGARVRRTAYGNILRM
jgi:hypothetical protein